MTERTTDNFKDVDEEEERPKGGRLRRFLLFFLTLLVVLAVVVVAAWRDGTGFDAVRRWLNYGTGAQVESKLVYQYDADRSNRFAPVGKSVLVASNTTVRLLSDSGEELYASAAKLNAPAISRGTSTVAVVDVGGTAVRVLDERGLVYELTADAQEPFLAATMNPGDYLAVSAQSKGYKGQVLVYSPGGERLYKFQSADRFVLDACVSADNKTLFVVTLTQEKGLFFTRVLCYPLDSDKMTASFDLPDMLTLSVANFGKDLAMVGDTSLSFATTEGTLLASYGYGGAFLRDYDLGGEGYATLLLNQYKAGSSGRLVTVNATGQELGELRVDEEILNLSAAGRYLAVLYADRLVIYTPDLLEYAKLEDIESARDVSMQVDGSVLVYGSELAGRYLP